MGLLYFLDRYIKPKMLRGTQIIHPEPTSVLTHGVSCIRQGDVNLWFYTKDKETIAIDTGHLDEPDTDRAFESIGIDPCRIHHVLLTHADVDHCGGVDAKAKNYLFPNAQIYLSEKEEVYLKGSLHRMKKLRIKIYNCVRLRPGYRLLYDEQLLKLGDISVRCILIPGHTVGHMCYIVDDKILFTGDCMAVNQNGGYAFWDFFCQDPETNKTSLQHLRDVVKEHPVECVCTGHSGFITDLEHFFDHIDTSAQFKGSPPFDPTAPKDVCRR